MYIYIYVHKYMYTIWYVSYKDVNLIMVWFRRHPDAWQVVEPWGTAAEAAAGEGTAAPSQLQTTG